MMLVLKGIRPKPHTKKEKRWILTLLPPWRTVWHQLHIVQRWHNSNILILLPSCLQPSTDTSFFATSSSSIFYADVFTFSGLRKTNRGTIRLFEDFYSVRKNATNVQPATICRLQQWLIQHLFIHLLQHRPTQHRLDDTQSFGPNVRGSDAFLLTTLALSSVSQKQPMIKTTGYLHLIITLVLQIMNC